MGLFLGFLFFQVTALNHLGADESQFIRGAWTSPLERYMPAASVMSPLGCLVDRKLHKLTGSSTTCFRSPLPHLVTTAFHAAQASNHGLSYLSSPYQIWQEVLTFPLNKTGTSHQKLNHVSPET